MNVLFTCAGRRNYLIRFFRDALNGEGKIVATDMIDTAPALQEADIPLVVPAVSSPGYVDSILMICEKYSIGLVISLNDTELPLLAKHEELFRNRGVKLLVSSEEVVDICFDKLKTIEFLKHLKLEYPATFLDIQSAETEIVNGTVQFPLFVKPRWGSASIQIYSVNSLEELRLAFPLAQLQLQKSFLRVSDDEVAESILIQQSLPGDEFGLDILNDLDGNVREVFVKQKLGMRAGETEKSRLVNESILHELGEMIGKKLGHIGNLDCDIFFDGENAVVLEMNPRFGGGYPFSHILGADFPAAILQWVSGSDTISSMDKRVYGTIVSKCDDLVLVS